MAPIEPPTKRRQLEMPSVSSAASTATWSRTVMRGKAAPHWRFPVGRNVDGPVLPLAAPEHVRRTRTLAAVDRCVRADEAVPNQP